MPTSALAKGTTMKTWILIADAAHARVLEASGPGKPLVPVPDFEMRADLPRSHDLGTDRPGRTHESVGTTRHAVEPRSDPHRQLKHDFAVRVAERLDAAAAAKSFDRLVVAAPPAMLGDLRQAMHKQTHQLIAAEVPKDLVKVADRDLRPHFADVIAF
jgi:protein required for attachment to host cells